MKRFAILAATFAILFSCNFAEATELPTKNFEVERLGRVRVPIPWFIIRRQVYPPVRQPPFTAYLPRPRRPQMPPRWRGSRTERFRPVYPREVRRR